jgi:hypothetical protein
MRTISNNLKKRLLAQSEEANFHGLDKVAAKISYQIRNTPTRDDFEEYVYSHNDLQNDVENFLWSAAIRTQDYYGKTANAEHISKLVEEFAGDLISSIRTNIGGAVIGPHEPFVPGERRMIVEIDEDGI